MSKFPWTLPEPEPIRSYSLNIRLTESEKQQVEDFASSLHVRPSALARHFVLQAIKYFTVMNKTGKQISLAEISPTNDEEN
jgi:hypothetical protein